VAGAAGAVFRDTARVLGWVSRSIYIRRQKASVTRLIRYSRYPGTRRYGRDSPGIDLRRPRQG